jgi:hypothetical protein
MRNVGSSFVPVRFAGREFPLLMVSPCFAQNQSTSNQPLISIVGTVEHISANVIYVKTGTQLVALSNDDTTEVWKGKVFHDLSPVVAGDSLIARYRTEASGKLFGRSDVVPHASLSR